MEDVTGYGWPRADPGGVQAVAARTCRAALVYRALSSPSGRYGQVRREQGPPGSRSSAPHTAFFRLRPTRSTGARYMHRYGTGREEMAQFASQNRDKALRSGHGYWATYRPEPLTVEAYLAGRWVSEPFCIFDCDIPVQGCGAFVITTADRAAALTRRPAYVRGIAAGRAHGRLAGPHLRRQHGARALLRRSLWANARLNPSEIDELENVRRLQPHVGDVARKPSASSARARRCPRWPTATVSPAMASCP